MNTRIETSTTEQSSQSSSDQDLDVTWTSQSSLLLKLGHGTRGHASSISRSDFASNSLTTLMIPESEATGKIRSQSPHIVGTMRPAMLRPWAERYASQGRSHSYFSPDTPVSPRSRLASECPHPNTSKRLTK
jgi:hypothetical protein